MTHIANKGDHKFDHLVGGYPRYEPSAGRPVQVIEEAFQVHRCGGPLVFPSVDEYEAHASGVLARMTTHIAERGGGGAAADRTRALVLPLETLGEMDSEVRRLLRSLIRSSHGTATPVVISCGTADSAQGVSGSAEANLDARIAAGRLR